MIAPVFVDANVLIYTVDSNEADKKLRASGWIDRLWREQAGRTSMQVLSEYYVITTRKLKPVLPADRAWNDVKSLLAWEPQPIDAMLLRRAREVEMRHRLSWWDSMVVAAAQLQDCALLLTEDMHDGAVYGGVTVRSPFTLAVDQEQARNEATPVHRHPPRGRPRKQGTKSRESAGA